MKKIHINKNNKQVEIISEITDTVSFEQIKDNLKAVNKKIKKWKARRDELQELINQFE